MTLVIGRCPLCLATQRQCTGHGPASTHKPVDIYTTKEKVMANEEPELKLYKYNVYGNEVEGQLTAEHAERIGATPVEGGDTQSGDQSGDTGTADTGATGDAASTTGTSTGATTKARTTAKNK